MKIILPLSLAFFSFVGYTTAEERWFTYIDETGQVQNLFLDDQFKDQQDNASSRISLSGYTSSADSPDSIAWQNATGAVKEDRRRYFSYVDGEGNLQSSFFSTTPTSTSKKDYVLGSGERISGYIDADKLQGQGFVREGDGLPFFTWMDESGQMQTGSISPEQRAMAFTSPSNRLPGLGTRQLPSDGHEILIRIPKEEPSSVASQSLTAELSTILDADREKRRSRPRSRDQQLVEDMRAGCCRAINLSNFIPLDRGDNHFETFNYLSPTYAFPSGISPYVGIVLPDTPGQLSVRVRSFADQGQTSFVYPTLLFLDGNREPTRMVTDAVYRLKPESWNSYASIEGIVQVKPWLGEKYLVVMTTDRDLQQQTLDNRPYDRPLDSKIPDPDEGLMARQHTQEGSFEVSLLKR